MIDNILYANGKICKKEYYTVHDIPKEIIKDLRFIIQKKQKPVDIVQDFLLEVCEGTFPLFKKEGCSIQQVVFRRFKNNYLIDYYRKMKGKETYEWQEQLSPEDEPYEETNYLLKLYLKVNKTNKLIILAELFKIYQAKFSEKNYLVNVLDIIPEDYLKDFKIKETFGRTFKNHSEVILFLDMKDETYRVTKFNLFKQLRENESFIH